MALARIISRSHYCARELATDLLARGYAVEIVSPDAVPDNLADLEVRVEADAANELTATVEARDGDHSASLDFVHHLKAPMGPFLRRQPEAGDAVYYPANPVNFNAEPDLAEEVGLPSDWRAPERQRPRLEILPVAEKAPVIAPPEHPTVVAPPEQQVPVTQQPAKDARGWITIKIRRSKTRLKQSRIAHSGAWVWRAGVAFAAVTVMALVLARGIYRGEAASSIDQASQVVPPKTVSVPEGSAVSKAQPEQTVSPIVPAHQEKSGAKPAQIARSSATRRPHANAKKSQVARSHRRTNDLIAPDTVTYLDRPASGVPVKNSSRTRASSHKQDAVATSKASPL